MILLSSYNTKLITNPNGFLEKLKGKEIRIKTPLSTIVFPLATILSIYQYILMSKLSQASPSNLARFFIVGAYIGIAGSFIGIFAFWLILAVIMHGISSFFNGKGSFRRTFEFVGYSFSPFPNRLFDNTSHVRLLHIQCRNS